MISLEWGNLEKRSGSLKLNWVSIPKRHFHKHLYQLIAVVTQPTSNIPLD